MLGFSSQELVIVQTARPNVLLIGGDAEVEAGLCLLARIVRQPMVCSRPPALTFPAKCDGSLVLREADALDASGQRQLLEWLTNTKPSPQIITTCSTPLFALVQGGAFMAALYYRLNAVTLILAPKEMAAVAG
jgi:hypothetical protein